MELIVPILLNCLCVVGIYLSNKHTVFKKLSYIKKQVVIGVVFGASSVFASCYGVEWLDAVVNVRDAAPLSAGLIFGAPAGIIAGIIGGVYRYVSVIWTNAKYTQLACSVATILAGLMAAGLRKLMFDDKKPTWGYGACIAVVCEVIHMILIFITNMDNSLQAFEFVKGAAIPMIIGNAIAVCLAIGVISLLGYEGMHKIKGERIANTFQRWLLTCIIAAYVVTSVFTYFLHDGMVSVENQEVFTVAIDDVDADIRGKSDAKLLEIAYSVKEEYLKGSFISLEVLAEKYGVKEINIVNEKGIIIDSTEPEVINNYDMNSKEQSKEFVDMLKIEDSFVQEYGPRGKDESILRKYAAVKLDNGGFIQVGYDALQFHQMLNEFVIDITKNRHVGTNGVIMVFDEKFNVVSNNEYRGMHITSLGIDIPDEMLNGKTATKLHDAYVIDKQTGETEKYIFVFKFIEGYCIVAAMPEVEAVFMRDAAIYTSIFMEILIFSSLFVFIYILIKRVIINNIKKINMTLSQITDGDLNVVVDVRSNEEFSSLSDDINSTVATLKYYIAEAAARIDKELEYAKQIQLSALPINFPDEKEYSIYAKMIAAREVGGDFYDFYKLNDTKVAFLVADVSGKGIPSAMFMMRAKTIIKDLAERGLNVNEIFNITNKKLCENNDSSMFVTAWMGIIDVKTGVMQFANAGHNPPLLRSANGEVKYLKTRPGFVLAGMDNIRYKVNEIKLSKGDRIFLYTDGVTEATDKEDNLFGETRLIEYMENNACLSQELFLNTLKNKIDEFVGDVPQFDDISMLIFDYKGNKENPMTYKTFAAKKDVLPEVFDFVEGKLESFGCLSKIQMAISVAIEEIFVNISNYAYHNCDGNVKIGISFDEENRIVTFQISDKGVKFNPLEASEPDITLSADKRDIGGLGIFITKKTMDTLTYTYQNKENILTMTKKI